MEKHKCKSCDKAFASGRALGGHMRSHFAKRPAPRHAPRAVPSTPPSELSSDSSVCHWAASAEEEEEEEEEGADFVTPFCSQRKRTLGASSPEENVALCLMMLSRDSWTPSVKPTRKAREEEGGEGEEGGKKHGNRSRYECDTCKKVFGSYQALGGHRGSHKKMKIQSSPPAENHFNFAAAAAVGGLGNIIKTYECPYCFKVFETGQALGGHKKIHTFNSILPTPPRITAAAADRSAHRHAAGSAPRKLIDLNLPAPLDDEEDEDEAEDSDNVAEVSAISDAAAHYANARR